MSTISESSSSSWDSNTMLDDSVMSFNDDIDCPFVEKYSGFLDNFDSTAIFMDADVQEDASVDAAACPPLPLETLSVLSSRRATKENIDTSPSPVSSSVSTTIFADLQLQYKDSMAKLALSIKRSELTGKEINNYNRAEETRARLQAARYQQLNNASEFLLGSRPTLTVGLEQSRQMLRRVISQDSIY